MPASLSSEYYSKREGEFSPVFIHDPILTIDWHCQLGVVLLNGGLPSFYKGGLIIRITRPKPDYTGKLVV